MPNETVSTGMPTKQCKNCEGHFDARYEPDVCQNCLTGETTIIKVSTNKKGYEVIGTRPYVPKNGATVPYVEENDG